MNTVNIIITLDKNLTQNNPQKIPFHLLHFITTERTIDFVDKNRCIINHCRADDTVQKGIEYSNIQSCYQN